MGNEDGRNGMVREIKAGDMLGGYRVVRPLGGGMGRAMCRALTDAGDEVWGLDLAAAGAEPWHSIRADVTSPEALEAALALVRQEAGELDGLIHMAGIYLEVTFQPGQPEKGAKHGVHIPV